MMQKKAVFAAGILLVAAVALLVFMRQGGGDTSHVNRVIGDSDLYTEREIEKMMDIVEKKFRRDFSGCTLTELVYDETSFGNQHSQAWAEQYEADRIVVITSSFEVDGSGGDGSLNPNSTYRNWEWILSQTGGGAWKLRDWGYA